jgi:hypothetical protein
MHTTSTFSLSLNNDVNVYIAMLTTFDCDELARARQVKCLSSGIYLLECENSRGERREQVFEVYVNNKLKL